MKKNKLIKNLKKMKKQNIIIFIGNYLFTRNIV